MTRCFPKRRGTWSAMHTSSGNDFARTLRMILPAVHFHSHVAQPEISGDRVVGAGRQRPFPKLLARVRE